jgi:hypothetical protein
VYEFRFELAIDVLNHMFTAICYSFAIRRALDQAMYRNIKHGMILQALFVSAGVV